jgi:hypothetical protein
MAENCQVMFHPICALVASNVAFWKAQHARTKLSTVTANADQPIERVLQEDEYLCTQFRLSKVEVGSTVKRDKVTLPVAFCGYHNPDRRPDLYGLYPAGQFLDGGAIRIPPLPGTDTATKDS